MPSCCVPSCTEETGKSYKLSDGPKISFHKLPKEPTLLKQLTSRIKRDLGLNIKVTKNTVICSKHYNVEDFYCYDPPSGRRQLKPGVLPSVFEFRPKPKQRKPRKELKSPAKTFTPDQEEAANIIEENKLSASKPVFESQPSSELIQIQSPHLHSEPAETQLYTPNEVLNGQSLVTLSKKLTSYSDSLVLS